MELTIAGHKITLYNQVTIRLKYDSIADTFGFLLYFNPDSATDKKIFKPLSYYPCTITHRGILIMTGTVLTHNFSSAGNPPKQLVYITGYTKTGVLGDSCVLNTDWKLPNGDSTQAGLQIMKVNADGTVTLNEASLQLNGLTLTSIVRAVTSWYELGEPAIDPELKKNAAFNTPYVTVIPTTKSAEDYRELSVAEFLDDLCKQKDVILSHTADGHVLLTKSHADKLLTTSNTFIGADSAGNRIASTFIKAPPVGGESLAFVESTGNIVKSRKVLYNFKDNDPELLKTQKPDGTWTGMNINYDGQALHTIIQVVGEQNNVNAADSSIINPYVAAGTPRYTRLIQTSGTDNDTPLTARAALKDELKNIVLTIDIQGWVLGGHLVTPNQLVTVTNKELYLYGTSTWFIQEVELYGDNETERATLTCVIPECFNDDDVKNRLF